MRIQVDLGERSYPIIIDSNLIFRLGEFLQRLSLGPRLCVITNDLVGGLYGRRLAAGLGDYFEVKYYELPDGEEYKSLESAGKLYTWAINCGVERGSAVVALGGGVIGDLAGFFAATYMRGIPLIQVPTTVLAQVDSSVGGKVAVNHPLGKNLIGSFYQPRLVLTDVSVLKTLPARELSSGLAEVVKYGVISDGALFGLLEREIERILALDEELLIQVIAGSCTIKAEIVEKDECETGLRMNLNFGHTIGHALEALTGYRVYRHGEAVAIGMVAAAAIAEEAGLCGPDLRLRLGSLLKRAGLPVAFHLPPEEIVKMLSRDKKAAGGEPVFVLPAAIGRVERRRVARDVVLAALEKCLAG